MREQIKGVVVLVVSWMLVVQPVTLAGDPPPDVPGTETGDEHTDEPTDTYPKDPSYYTDSEAEDYYERNGLHLKEDDGYAHVLGAFNHAILAAGSGLLLVTCKPNEAAGYVPASFYVFNGAMVAYAASKIAIYQVAKDQKKEAQGKFNIDDLKKFTYKEDGKPAEKAIHKAEKIKDHDLQAKALDASEDVMRIYHEKYRNLAIATGVVAAAQATAMSLAIVEKMQPFNQLDPHAAHDAATAASDTHGRHGAVAAETGGGSPADGNITPDEMHAAEEAGTVFVYDMLCFKMFGNTKGKPLVKIVSDVANGVIIALKGLLSGIKSGATMVAAKASKKEDADGRRKADEAATIVVTVATILKVVLDVITGGQQKALKRAIGYGIEAAISIGITAGHAVFADMYLAKQGAVQKLKKHLKEHGTDSHDADSTYPDAHSTDEETPAGPEGSHGSFDPKNETEQSLFTKIRKVILPKAQDLILPAAIASAAKTSNVSCLKYNPKKRTLMNDDFCTCRKSNSCGPPAAKIAKSYKIKDKRGREVRMKTPKILVESVALNNKYNKLISAGKVEQAMKTGSRIVEMLPDLKKMQNKLMSKGRFTKKEMRYKKTALQTRRKVHSKLYALNNIPLDPARVDGLHKRFADVSKNNGYKIFDVAAANLTNFVTNFDPSNEVDLDRRPLELDDDPKGTARNINSLAETNLPNDESVSLGNPTESEGHNLHNKHVKDHDVVKNSDVSIFQVISSRYLKKLFK